MTKRQTASTKSFAALAKTYEEGFGVGLESTSKGKTFTVKELAGTPHKGSTASSRLNWLKRRAREHGFQPTGTAGEYEFVGTEAESDENPDAGAPSPPPAVK